MTTRADAERRRGDYFRALLQKPAPADVDAKALWSQKLALFEAAHLDYQRAYFRSAERRHTRGASFRAWPRTSATNLTIVGIAIGGVAVLVGLSVSLLTMPPWLTVLFDDPIRWQLGFNTAASALLSYASTMITQDERNAALYAATGQRLDALRTPERRKAVADAAAADDSNAVLAYATEAQAILDADHQAWMLNRPPADPTAPPPDKFRV